MADTEASIFARVAPDGMTAALCVSPTPEAVSATLEQCEDLLAGERVTVTDAVRDEIRVFLARAQAEATEGVAHTVARGTPPQHGEDGQVEITATPEVPEGIENEGDDEETDHRAKVSYIAVREGDVVGWWVDPTPGTDGETVTGKAVAAKRGAPARMKVAKTIEKREDGCLVAAVSGVLIFNRDAARVDSQFIIPGFVDYTTGNILLEADCSVGKGVRDGFVIDIDGNLEVKGLVEAATIRVGHKATLLGGMAGRGKSELTVGRDAWAKYLDNVDGHIGRDLTVIKEIVNCRLSVVRRLTMERGAIVGGRVCVGGACRVHTLGGEAGVETEVILGRAPEAEALLQRAATLLARIGSRQARSENEREQMERVCGDRPRTRAQAARLAQLAQEIESLQHKADRVKESADRLQALVSEHTEVDLVVLSEALPGVRLRMGGWILTVREPLRGPIRFRLDARGEPWVTDYLSGEVRPLRGVVSFSIDKTYQPSGPTQQAA